MGLLETIGFALALAMLAGLNVYLVVLLVGLAVRLEWFPLAGQAELMAAFGHPAVLGLALALALIEFLVDKTPWADSLWDSIHTFLRPAGGVLLALTVCGEIPLSLKILVGVGAGAVTLLVHLFKAGTRMRINTSPEPFSNVGASVLENAIVVGGFILAMYHPLIALAVFLPALALILWLTPGSVRAIRGILWLVYRKLRIPARDHAAGKTKLPTKLSADENLALDRAIGDASRKIEWAVQCLTGKVKGQRGLRRNQFGNLIAIREHPGLLWFSARHGFRHRLLAIDVSGSRTTHESGFLSERLDLSNRKGKQHLAFRFHRGQADLVDLIVGDLQHTLANLEPVHESAIAESESKPEQDREEQEQEQDLDEKQPEDEREPETEEATHLSPIPLIGAHDAQDDKGEAEEKAKEGPPRPADDAGEEEKKVDGSS